MMQVGAGLPCEVGLGKDKTVKPLHLREAQRGRLICTGAQDAQRSLCRQGCPLLVVFPDF